MGRCGRSRLSSSPRKDGTFKLAPFRSPPLPRVDDDLALGPIEQLVPEPVPRDESRIVVERIDPCVTMASPTRPPADRRPVLQAEFARALRGGRSPPGRQPCWTENRCRSRQSAPPLPLPKAQARSGGRAKYTKRKTRNSGCIVRRARSEENHGTIGSLPFASMPINKVRALRDRKAQLPEAADGRVKALRHATGGGPRHRPISFPAMYRRGPPHRALQWYTATPQGSGSATSPTLRVRQLLFSAPQSSDKPISSELGLCVRVVAAIAARTIALFSGDRVIGGQMMAPETRSKHGDRSPRLTLKAGRSEVCKAGH